MGGQRLSTPIEKVVAKNLKKTMERKRLSQFILSEKAGIKYDTLENFLNADPMHLANLEHLDKLAKGLKVDVREFFRPIKK